MDFYCDPNMTLDQFSDRLYYQNFCSSFDSNQEVYNNQRDNTYLAAIPGQEWDIQSSVAPLETYNFSTPQAISFEPSGGYETYLAAMLSLGKTPSVSEPHLENIEEKPEEVLEKNGELTEVNHEDHVLETIENPLVSLPSSLTLDVEEETQKNHAEIIIEKPLVSLPQSFTLEVEEETQKDLISCPFFIFPEKSKFKMLFMVFLSQFEQFSPWHELNMPSFVIANAMGEISKMKFC